MEKHNTVEKNVKIKELENTVNEMTEKINQLEEKQKDTESKYVEVIKTKKAAAKIIDIKIVQHQKSISKDQ